MTPWFLLGQNKVNYPTLPNDIVTDNDEARSHIRKAGAASAVLLKNSDNTLPLKKPKSIALFGIDAGDDPLGPNGSGKGYQVAPGVCWKLLATWTICLFVSLQFFIQIPGTGQLNADD